MFVTDRRRVTCCGAAVARSGDTAATHHNQLFRFISDHVVELQRRSRVQCRGAPGGCRRWCSMGGGGGGARSRGTGRGAVISSCNSLM